MGTGNVSTNFSLASNLNYIICFFSCWFVHLQNLGNYERFSCLGKGKVMIESSAKINVNHYQIENLETPIKQYTNDKCKENVLKET